MEGPQFEINFPRENNDKKDEKEASNLDFSQEELDELYKDDHLDQYQDRR